MGWTENVLNLAVILGLLIRIHNQQSNGGSRCHPLKDTRQNLNFVRLLTLRRKTRCAGLPAIEIRLQIGCAERQAGWAPVDDAAKAESMTLTEGCNGK